MSLIRRSGPAESGQTTSTPPSADNDSNVPRCQRCQRGISAPQSVARMHGPVCWHRRFDASVRLVPLNCGCADSWAHHCIKPSLTERSLDGYAEAARHLLNTAGCLPLVPLEALRALYRRGGDDRALAEQLHAATGGVVT